jgi:hypothetical protein
LTSDGRVISNDVVAQVDVEEKKEDNKITHVYIRNNTVGDFSYHLSENGGSFIYMKNVSSKQADNGSFLPDKITFVDAKLDMKSRIFTGTIPLDDYPIQRSVVWKYVMEFSEDWSTIQGGQ